MLRKTFAGILQQKLTFCRLLHQQPAKHVIQLKNRVVASAVIGRSGQNIQSTRAKFPLVTINIHTDEDVHEAVLAGPDEEVSRAKEHIQDEVSKLGYNEIQLKNAAYASTIIGKGGQNIEKVKLKYPNVCIDFSGYSEDPRKVYLCGPVEEVTSAKQHILDELSKLGYSEIQLENASLNMKAILRKDDPNIERVRLKYPNVNIGFFKSEDQQKVYICGPVEEVTNAKQHILDQLSKLECSEIQLANSLYIGAVIGKGGNNIKKMREKFPNVFVKVSKSEDHPKVYLYGPAEEVTNAKQYILDQLSKLEYSDMELENALYISAIIGKGAQNIRKARSLFPNVTIIIDGSHQKIRLLCPRGDMDEVRQYYVQELAKLTKTFSGRHRATHQDSEKVEERDLNL